MVLLPFQQAVGRAHERAGDDARLAEEFGVDAYLQFGGTALQAVHLLVPVLGATLAVLSQVANGFTDAPEQFVVGMGLEAALVGEGEHLVVDTRGVADAQHVDTAVYEPLGDPVDGHVRLRTHQHLWLAVERFEDGFDERGGLARAGRAVHDGHILRPQHHVDGLLLRRVEPGEGKGSEGEEAGGVGGGCLGGGLIEQIA